MTVATVVIATVNREHGSTGVHTHTRSLRDGLAAAGVACDVVTPFGSPAWLPIFAVRPLLLNRLNPTWATRWYRHWHGAAVRAHLRRRLAAGLVDRIVAQCPVSAAAAMDVAGGVPVTMVCHFNHSEAAEYRDQGVLAGEGQYQRMLAGEDDVLRRVDGVVYVSEWARGVVERDRGVTPRRSAVVRNGIAAEVPVPSVTRAAIGVAGRRRGAAVGGDVGAAGRISSRWWNGSRRCPAGPSSSWWARVPTGRRSNTGSAS